MGPPAGPEYLPVSRNQESMDSRAALCIEHGVSDFLTGDRDFRRFSSLNVVNPFQA